MPSQSRRSRRPTHIRILIVGCGLIARCLARPLSWHSSKISGVTFEIHAIDGDETKARSIADDMKRESPSLATSAIPEYLVAANIARYLMDDDIVLVCTSNRATRKLISDHAEMLKSVFVIAGACYWTDGLIQVHVRRGRKNTTLPLANIYHPEVTNPTDRIPGDEDETGKKEKLPQSVVAYNAVAAQMLVAFCRVQCCDSTEPLPCEIYIDAFNGRVMPRSRT